ncbi:MAG: hypothetical protein QGG88_00650 [Gammaproteobacteria bacterium]|nr:hypothetical protein [Gammaproteobacteria bacterium]
MGKISDEGWSLGLYMGVQGSQAVLLQRRWGRMRVHAYWRLQADPDLTYPAIPAGFLQPVVTCLQALGRVTELAVNIGLPYAHCAFQPLPVGGPVRWQRQAAAYWQLAPAQIYLDALPIAPQTGLLVSTPCQPLEPVLSCVNSLQSVIDKPLRIGLETDVTSIFKVWPWRLRQLLSMVSWLDDKQGLFVDQGGLHICQLADLPSSAEHYLWCHHNSVNWPVTGTMWRWQVADLPSDMLLAWHLAYMPGVRGRPQVAWHNMSPLTLKQRLCLATGRADYRSLRLIG